MNVPKTGRDLVSNRRVEIVELGEDCEIGHGQTVKDKPLAAKEKVKTPNMDL
jgi:hypothetical protein